jgi:hypothetical protein
VRSHRCEHDVDNRAQGDSGVIRVVRPTQVDLRASQLRQRISAAALHGDRSRVTVHRQPHDLASSSRCNHGAVSSTVRSESPQKVTAVLLHRCSVSMTSHRREHDHHEWVCVVDGSTAVEDGHGAGQHAATVLLDNDVATVAPHDLNDPLEVTARH